MSHYAESGDRSHAICVTGSDLTDYAMHGLKSIILAIVNMAEASITAQKDCNTIIAKLLALIFLSNIHATRAKITWVDLLQKQIQLE